MSGTDDLERNPWRTLARTEVYANPWLTLREDRVVRPDGAEGIYGVVSPRSLATGVVALDEQQRVWLVGQYRYTLDVYSWEIVAGGADPGEDPLVGAQRELREEAGLAARSWRPLGAELHLSNSVSDERGFLFLAQDLERVGEPQPEGTEVLQLRQVPLAEAVAMALAGRISDAMSVLGLLQAERLLRT